MLSGFSNLAAQDNHYNTTTGTLTGSAIVERIQFNGEENVNIALHNPGYTGEMVAIEHEMNEAYPAYDEVGRTRLTTQNQVSHIKILMGISYSKSIY